MLDPCNPCVCPGAPCEQCTFGYRSKEDNHENMKSLIERVESGEKPIGWRCVETYKTYHKNWREEAGITDRESNIVANACENLFESIMRAKELAIRKGIEANSIVINKNMVEVEPYDEFPRMICGLNIHFTSRELPDNYSFAVFNNPNIKNHSNRLQRFESIGMEPEELEKAAELYRTIKERFNDPST